MADGNGFGEWRGEGASEEELREVLRRTASGAASIGFASGVLWARYHGDLWERHEGEDAHRALQALARTYREHFERRHRMHELLEGVDFEIDPAFLRDLEPPSLSDGEASAGAGGG